jgi:hypothetical protein
VLDNALPSFVHPAAHSYAPPLIHMLRHSFIHSAAHSYAPFRFCIHSYAPPSLRVRVRLRSFMSPAARSRSCPRPHALQPYASVGASSAPGPFRMYELLWSVTTQGRHYKQTSPWVSFAPPHPFATSQCMQMNFCSWSVHAAVHVMGEVGSKDQWRSEQGWDVA